MAYSQEDKQNIIKKVLSEIESGLSLRKAIYKLSIISRDQFNEWLKEDKEISDQYAKSCEFRRENKFEEIQDIADDDTGIYFFDEAGNKKIDSAAIQRKRLQIDARKWQLSKEDPKKYGDKVQTEHTGEIKQTIVKWGDKEIGI